MLSFTEIHSWLSIRPIEFLFILTGWLIYTILIVLHKDFNYNFIKRYHLFLPLFFSNIIHGYFLLIVILRIWFEHNQRTNLTKTFICRLILNKLFLHIPIIVCLTIFNYLLYKTYPDENLLTSHFSIHCIIPLYLFAAWMFLKIFVCKKQNNITVVVQS